MGAKHSAEMRGVFAHERTAGLATAAAPPPSLRVNPRRSASPRGETHIKYDFEKIKRNSPSSDLPEYLLFAAGACGIGWSGDRRGNKTAFLEEIDYGTAHYFRA